MLNLTLDELIKRIEVFDDSIELAISLREIKGDGVAMYYCKEAAVNLENMFILLMDIKKAINVQNTKG